MKIDEYKNLIEEDVNKHKPFSCECCVDRNFLTLISYFTIIKNAKGLRTIENILNSYKVTEVDDVEREIDLMKVPKSIREKVNEHANNPFVKKQVAEKKRKDNLIDEDSDFRD